MPHKQQIISFKNTTYEKHHRLGVQTTSAKDGTLLDSDSCAVSVNKHWAVATC